MSTRIPTTTIPPVAMAHGKLALGCWAFGGAQWGGQDDADSIAAMTSALECGMNHFDTASGYGAGRSENLVGDFLKEESRREKVYLATKQSARADLDHYARSIDESLARLKTDYVDLYYIHWPRKGVDLARVMEVLEKARTQGKVRSIGVSNFSAEQMAEASKGGKIDAHQIGYSMLWRYPERDVFGYCREHDIAIATYSSIAQGILTGKFGRHPEFKEGDSRGGMVLFDKDVWPHLYEAVEKLKAIAAETGRSLTHLAIQWVATQSGVASILVGVRNAGQVEDNAPALDDPVDASVIDRMTAIADEAMSHVPDVGNIFRHYP